MSEAAEAQLNCEHYWAWVSPAGTSKSARICMLCLEPDVAWLNDLADRKGKLMSEMLVGGLLALLGVIIGAAIINMNKERDDD